MQKMKHYLLVKVKGQVITMVPNVTTVSTDCTTGLAQPDRQFFVWDTANDNAPTQISVLPN